MPPSCFVVRELLCLVRLSIYFTCTRLIFHMVMILMSIFLFLAASSCPHFKKRYHTLVNKVREYLEMVKNFDELISPQSLFLHFLGPKPSKHVQKNIDLFKKGEFTKFSFS